MNILSKKKYDLTKYAQQIHDAKSLCPDKSSVFDIAHAKDLYAITLCMGDLFDGSQQGQSPTSSRTQYAKPIIDTAAQAMLIMEDCSYRQWTEGDLPNSLICRWARTVWRFALTYPIGFIVANHSIKKSKTSTSFNPAFTNLVSYAGAQDIYIAPSNRPLSPTLISLATFNRLFNDYDDAKACPMHYFAITDAFSDTPNRDNPIVRAYRRAIQKVILSDTNMTQNIPYYLADAINHLFRADPAYHSINYLAPTTNHKKTDAPKAPIVTSLSTNSLLESPAIESISKNQSTVEQSIPESIKLLSDKALRTIRSLVQENPQEINGKKGALLFYWNNRLLITCPKGIQRIAERITISEEELTNVLLSTKVIEVNASNKEQYMLSLGVTPDGAKKMVAKLSVAVLSQEATSFIFPNGTFHLTNNPDLSLVT